MEQVRGQTPGPEAVCCYWPARVTLRMVNDSTTVVICVYIIDPMIRSAEVCLNSMATEHGSWSKN